MKHLSMGAQRVCVRAKIVSLDDGVYRCDTGPCTLHVSRAEVNRGFPSQNVQSEAMSAVGNINAGSSR